MSSPPKGDANHQLQLRCFKAKDSIYAEQYFYLETMNLVKLVLALVIYFACCALLSGTAINLEGSLIQLIAGVCLAMTFYNSVEA